MVLPNKITVPLSDKISKRDLKCPDYAGVLRLVDQFSHFFGLFLLYSPPQVGRYISYSLIFFQYEENSLQSNQDIFLIIIMTIILNLSYTGKKQLVCNISVHYLEKSLQRGLMPCCCCCCWIDNNNKRLRKLRPMLNLSPLSHCKPFKTLVSFYHTPHCTQRVSSKSVNSVYHL